MTSEVISQRRAALVVSAEDAGRRLDQVLASRVAGLSRAQAQRLIRDGHVTISRGTARPSLAVAAGLSIEVALPVPAPAAPAPEALPLTLLHDDSDIVVIDKPAGMVVHPAAGHATGTLVNALLHHVGGLSGVGGIQRPGLVHRLDRGTSGVMVVAKHDHAHRALARQFHDRQVGKEYVALVWGTPRAGQIFERPIGRDPKHRQKMSSRARRTRTALTRVIDVEALDGVSLVRLSIGTGRTHQIRVHLSEAGHPVVGDALYGGVRRRLPPRLAGLGAITRPFLHAARLTLMHPSNGRRMTFDAPLPADLEAVLQALRKTSRASA
jgi:23S rRNA pseudouridine1911/1915/1917 synthase